MSPEDQRLVAALAMLADQLSSIIDEVLASQFDQAERRDFARVLATIAAELDPGTLEVPAAQAQPRYPFSASGPGTP